eukprot:1549332-Alexandrium_andersonii.AAC.1
MLLQERAGRTGEDASIQSVGVNVAGVRQNSGPALADTGRSPLSTLPPPLSTTVRPFGLGTRSSRHWGGA